MRIQRLISRLGVGLGRLGFSGDVEIMQFEY